MPANRLGVLLDLDRQLARRRDDQRTRVAVLALGHGRRGQQTVHDCDQKRCGLAGAGLRLTGDIAPDQCHRQRHVLNRRATGESAVGNALLQQRMQIKGGKKSISENSL